MSWNMLRSTLITEIMCEKRRKQSTFGNSHYGAQTDTMTNCGTVQVLIQNGKRSQTVLET